MANVKQKGNKDRVTVNNYNLIKEYTNIIISQNPDIRNKVLFDLFAGSMSLIEELVNKDILPKITIVNDINSDLMDYYSAIMDMPEQDAKSKLLEYSGDLQTPISVARHKLMGLLNKKKFNATYSDTLKKLFYSVELTDSLSVDKFGMYDMKTSKSCLVNKLVNRCRLLHKVKDANIMMYNTSYNNEYEFNYKKYVDVMVIRDSLNKVIAVTPITDEVLFLSEAYTTDYVRLPYFNKENILYLDSPYYNTSRYTGGFTTDSFITFLRGGKWSVDNYRYYDILHKESIIYFCEYAENLEMYLRNGINLEILCRHNVELRNMKEANKIKTEVFCRVIPYTREYLNKYSRYFKNHVVYYDKESMKKVNVGIDVTGVYN